MIDSAVVAPVTLSQWPSCNDCLVASQDDLAVACGEIVHILTPKTNSNTKRSSSRSQWHTSTIRVNLFSEDEWPYQSTATFAHLSLGEEQSESIAISLAWSLPGLGLHKRSVLAVLTSNLVLSLWETNGLNGTYQRSCIVNKTLITQVEVKNSIGAERRPGRIRAFAWLPALPSHSILKQKGHCLLVVDDASMFTVLRLSKSSSSSIGTFVLEKVSNFALQECFQTQSTLPISPLQRRIIEESPITRVMPHLWNKSISGDTDRGDMISRVDVVKGRLLLSLDVVATVQVNDSATITPYSEGSSYGYTFSVKVANQTLRTAPVADSISLLTDVRGEPVDQEDIFKTALKPLIKTFDQEHKLFGHHRVRYWGACTAHNVASYVACVTMHPSDMIEHVQPSLARCMLVFAAIVGYSSITEKMMEPENVAQKRIIDFAISKSRETHTFGAVDARVYAVLVALAYDLNIQSANIEVLENAWARAQAQSTTNAPSSYGSRAKIGSLRHAPEHCEICSESIAFSRDTNLVACRSGHQFTRCNLSFLSIQEPGVSKYCSECGKQFLDTAKLGMPDGPSFMRALFDEFDLCPYCQAKFQG